jgi:hypothetical protein
MKFTGYSDGTGETGVVKVNATSAHGVVIAGQTYFPLLNIKVRRIVYDVQGEIVRVQWVATTNADLAVLTGFGTMDFEEFGGVPCPGTTALPGATGSIAFTTVNQFVGSSYTITMQMTKGVPQS